MKNLVITLEGGAIQAMYAEAPIRVTLVDYDVEGEAHTDTIHYTDPDAPPAQAVLSTWSTNDEGIAIDMPWVMAVAAQAQQSRDAYARRITGQPSFDHAKQALLPGCSPAERAADAVRSMLQPTAKPAEPDTRHRLRVSFELSTRFEGGLGDVIDAKLPRHLQPPSVDDLLTTLRSMVMVLEVRAEESPSVKQLLSDARTHIRRLTPFAL